MRNYSIKSTTSICKRCRESFSYQYITGKRAVCDDCRDIHRTESQKASALARKMADPERYAQMDRERGRRYRERHREQVRARSKIAGKQYIERNREKVSERRQKYRETHKQEITGGLYTSCTV